MGKVYERSLASAIVWIFVLPCVCAAASITTHHVDNFRTGWNSQESVLTAANVNASFFAQQAVTPLNGQVDAQPLVLSNQNVNGTVYPIVVYVATENNTIYAIDGTGGTVLAVVSLESGVLNSTIFSGSCHNNDSIIGINSTPVIDSAAGTLYVVTATAGSGTITYHLHALSTSTLTDKLTPMTITPPSGVTYSRQRAALTLFNGGVLIAFTSFCDNAPSTSLGHLVFASMGAANSQASFQTSVYNLSTIWMSGSGPAVYNSDIYFSTGNETVTNPALSPPNTNLPDSLVRLQGSSATAPSLSFGSSITPDTSILGSDQDFGSGAVLIVPAGAPSSISSSTAAQFVTGVGKQGRLYVNNMSLTSPYVQAINVGGDCHCGTSFFSGADGQGHVVTSAGGTLGLYTVSSSGLTLSSSTSLPAKAAGDPGTFTTISSNGTAAGSAVIWTVSGPDSSGSLGLYAYNATNLSSLYADSSGYWPNAGANANSVPVVANGHVYVASYGALTIWGGAAGALPTVPTGLSADPNSVCPNAEVSWNSSAGATSYKVYMVTGGAPWNPGIRQLKYSGSLNDVTVKTSGHLQYGFEVAACNQYGCSNPSGSVWTTIPLKCPIS